MVSDTTSNTTSKVTTSNTPSKKMAHLDSFDFDPGVCVAELADQKKRAAENLERPGKRPNLNDLALLERPTVEFDITDYRHPNYLDHLFGGGPEPALEEGAFFDCSDPDFLKYIFEDPTGVATPAPVPPPEPRVRQVRQLQAVAVDGDWKTLNHHWKQRAGIGLQIPDFAAHNLFPWASVKKHLGTVTPEVRAAVMAKEVPTWGVENRLPVLLVPTAIGTALLKYRGDPYRSCRGKPKGGPVTRRVSPALQDLLGEVKDGILHTGHIDTMFGSTGEETAWRFHNVDPMTITVCPCRCLRAPKIAHDCANKQANLMTNDILLGCAAHHDLTIANLHRGDKLGYKVNTVDLNCDGPSSASLPLFFIYGGDDECAASPLEKELLDDITGEGSREYKQKGITPIQRRFTFHQFPVNVTQVSSNFHDFTYKEDKGELTQIDYPTLIAEWNAARPKARAPRVTEPTAPAWGDLSVVVPRFEVPRLEAFV